MTNLINATNQEIVELLREGTCDELNEFIDGFMAQWKWDGELSEELLQKFRDYAAGVNFKQTAQNIWEHPEVAVIVLKKYVPKSYQKEIKQFLMDMSCTVDSDVVYSAIELIGDFMMWYKTR